MLLFLLGLTACSDYEFERQSDLGNTEDPGTLTGRICNEDVGMWMSGVLVYTHIYEWDTLIDTVMDTTDEDGEWRLEELPGNAEYEIFTQYGSEILSRQYVYIEAGEEQSLATSSTCEQLRDVKVASINGDYDNIAQVLREANVGDIQEVNGLTGDEMLELLLDLEAMKEFDLICFGGGHLEEGIFYDTVGGAGATPLQVMDNLRAYVNEGGTVFASDWSYDVIEQAFPDAVDFMGDDTIPDEAQWGAVQSVQARVSDPDLSAYMGEEQVPVSYPLPTWPVITAVGPDTEVMMRGDAEWFYGMEGGILPDSPLLLRAPQGQGQVVYATYRFSENWTDVLAPTFDYLLEGIEQSQ